MIAQTLKSIHIQQFFIRNSLAALFGRHASIPLEIIDTILSFLFASPFKPKNTFILKQGTLLLHLHQQSQDSPYHGFFITNPNQAIITANSRVTLKQGDQLMVGNRNCLNQKLKVSKIWTKPQTRTQMKILTYCPKFKQFMLGKHHQTKMIDQRYLQREFLVPHHEKDIFDKYLKDVQDNDANFCSNHVLDSYMALITMNYIEFEVEANEFNDTHDKRYKVVPQGSDSELLNGIKLVFDENLKKWELTGRDLVVWKEQKVFSRKKTLVRTFDGRVDLIEGETAKSVSEFVFMFDQENE